MKTDRDFENVQFVYDFIANSYLTVSEETKKELGYYHYLTPFSEPYFGVTNPVLLFCGHRQIDLASKKTWTIRDGLITLSIFFKEIKPESITSELYIPASLWFIVPNDWRSKVKYYDYSAGTVYNKNNLPKKILITGFLNSTMADADEFKMDLEQVEKIIGKENLEKMDIIGYFPSKRNDLWGGWRDENVLKYSKYLFQHLKMDISFPELYSITSESNYQDCLYLEINRGYFVKESFMKHLALSRGAGMLDLPVVNYPLNKISSTKVSLYHSINIYSLDEDRAQDYQNPLTDKSFEAIQAMLMLSSKDVKFSKWWESWFATYLKKYYSEGSTRFSL